MKNLILCAIASLFLFTSCFETTDEVTVVPEMPPITEGNVMECEQVTKFIAKIQSVAPPSRTEDQRASIDKYLFDNKTVYMLMTPSFYFTDTFPIVIDSNCNIICIYSEVREYSTCEDLNVQEVKFIESVWVDNR